MATIVAPSVVPHPVDDVLVDPDKNVLAQNIVTSKRAKNKKAPQQAQLAQAISSVQFNPIMSGGVSNLVITLTDPDFALLESGFLDTDADSQMDPIDVNYPAGSKYWWRMTQVSPSGAAETIQLTFMPRGAALLLALKGPLKAARGQVTRAQFLQMCADKVKDFGGINFHSSELKTVEPIAATKAPTAPSGSSATTPAVATSGKSYRMLASWYSANGGAGACGNLSDGGLHYAELGTATAAGATGRGNMAIDFGLPGELPCGYEVTISYNGRTAKATKADRGDGNPSVPPNDPSQRRIDLESKLANALGFSGLGYVDVIPGGPTPGGSTGTSSAPGPGGAANAGKVTVQAYYFEIGPNETLWDGMLRLAQEVDWALFWDGDDLYYDSQPALLDKPPVLTVSRRDSLWVQDWSYDWDTRHIVTQMTLSLFCGMFDFRPGDVLELQGFGTASTGSTVKPPKPGRWLIDSGARDKNNVYTPFTLVQPALPKAEPAPQVSVSSPSSGAGGLLAGGVAGSPKTVAAAVSAAQRLSNLRMNYSQAHRTLTQDPSIGADLASGSGGYDCSAGVSWVLLTAGFPLPAGVTWGGWAPVSGEFESWGDPGPGKEMTVWSSGDHIFIEFNVPGLGHYSFDSGHPSSAHTWFAPFYDGGYTASGAFTPRHWPGT